MHLMASSFTQLSGKNIFKRILKLHTLCRTLSAIENASPCDSFAGIRTHQLHCLKCLNQKTKSVETHTDSSDSIPADDKSNSRKKFKTKLHEGPSLQDFISKGTSVSQSDGIRLERLTSHPYIAKDDVSGNGRKVYFEVYGCQMNVNDTEIAWAILQEHGYLKTTNIKEADVILVMTCSIREGAERKVWHLLDHLKALKCKRGTSKNGFNLKIGILGCMAERLKNKLVEEDHVVDLVAGPDSYKDLPRMLAITENGQTSVNVLLSLDETYADIIPVRMNEESKTAFVSIMRGCDNMCSYCIVPFTRGRERSRPMSSILDEIKLLSDKGFKEITLLGQNVNSFRYMSIYESNAAMKEPTSLSRGFTTIYKTKLGGLRFADLLNEVSLINPEMRIRFTSPHPKDFPDEVLHVIKERKNICKQIHLPAQSGNDRVLKVMRRGYDRESYLNLVQHIRSIIPGVAITSDFICGFCDETEDEFLDTLTLVRKVKYSFVFVFPYSLRQKTHAYHKMMDSVPYEVKVHRVNRVVAAFREEAEILNRQKIGTRQLILVEGPSKRSANYLFGKNEQNIKVIIPDDEIASHHDSAILRSIQPGDYLVAQINDGSSQVLKGIPLYHTTLQEFNEYHQEKFNNIQEAHQSYDVN